MPNVIPVAALWQGNHRSVAELRRTYYWDAGDPRAGQKLGKSYGTMYRRTPAGLVPLKYGPDGKELVRY